MQYLVLCYLDEKVWDAIPELHRVRDGMMLEYGELLRDLDNGGHHPASARLQSTATATTVRGRNGKGFVTDGPYAETKEQLGG
jgi:hypothetical protein